MAVVELISTAEAARRKEVDQSSVRRAIREGRLRGSKYNRDYLLDPSDPSFVAWKPPRRRKETDDQLPVHEV